MDNDLFWVSENGRRKGPLDGHACGGDGEGQVECVGSNVGFKEIEARGSEIWQHVVVVTRAMERLEWRGCGVGGRDGISVVVVGTVIIVGLWMVVVMSIIWNGHCRECKCRWEWG